MAQFLLFLSYFIVLVWVEIRSIRSDEIYEEKTTATQRRSQCTF
jgi:hypothetical protein